ncbi:MAG: DsrE family protein [Verrucomicrobiota bacterium]|nr:DsrE family protein [Verrucomicrobiota bacterium]
MSYEPKKFGLMVSVAPDAPGFGQALELAAKALGEGEKVYLYCIDDAVPGIGDPRLVKLRDDGLNLFGCAYSMRQRKLPLDDSAVFSGLSVLSDIMADTDRFESFN